MVNNIKSSGRENIQLSTNGGVLETKQKVDLPDWEEAWFNPNTITDIFTYAEMADT